MVVIQTPSLMIQTWASSPGIARCRMSTRRNPHVSAFIFPTDTNGSLGCGLISRWCPGRRFGSSILSTG
jgi:hypothetical protein